MTGATRPRLLVTGVGGQVGFELLRTLATLGEVLPADRTILDLGAPESLRATVRELRPDVIVNAAAYTAVDKAEEEPALATAVNARAPGVLAEEAERLGAAMVHFSTDYVFDGSKGRPYGEDDAPAPLNVYGETKLAGERAVLDALGAAIVLRTTWIYGLRGRNFLLTIRRLAAERDELRIVEDQVGAPTWCRSIAEATAQILARTGGSRERVTETRGCYHLSAAGTVSWHGFARRIVALDGNEHVRVEGIPTTDFPTPARRPPYSVLDNTRLRDTFGIHMPGWDAALALAMTG